MEREVCKCRRRLNCLAAHLHASLAIAMALGLTQAQALLLLLLHRHALLLDVLLDGRAYRAVGSCALLVVLEQFPACQTPARNPTDQVLLCISYRSGPKTGL